MRAMGIVGTDFGKEDNEELVPKKSKSRNIGSLVDEEKRSG
jgi:hypothetical protein